MVSGGVKAILNFFNIRGGISSPAIIALTIFNTIIHLNRIAEIWNKYCSIPLSFYIEYTAKLFLIV